VPIALVEGFELIMVCDDVRGVRDAATRCGVAGKVTQMCNVDDSTLAQLYRAASATLVPSFVEGFGLPALESLSCGTQVIFWKGCKSVAEVCGSHGISISVADDAEEWALAMNSVVSLPDTGFDRSAYSWHAVASRVNRVLEARHR